MLDQILKNLDDYADKTAFLIDNKEFTYADLRNKIGIIYNELLKTNVVKNDIIGIITHNALETYASIFATWFTGATFLPINPRHPKSRNSKILEQVQIKRLISVEKKDKDLFDMGDHFMNTSEMTGDKTQFEVRLHDSDHILYLIFTSGSTGNPKGVQISQQNLESFITSFLDVGYKLDHNDRFLQFYDLSFDASFHCYVLPVYLGATVYTVKASGMKYLEAVKLMAMHRLTFVKMPPSTINLLKPYLPDLEFPHVRYSLFGGEALTIQALQMWKQCVPNAEIHNVYGPTEATINCLYYRCPDDYKSFNGIISIGKTTPNLKALVINEQNEVLKLGEIGELCIAGNQVTPGYLQENKNNRDSFIHKHVDGQKMKFYKTGDLVKADSDGDFFYLGRKDSQIQVHGYRVEIGEIENAAREASGINNCIVVVNEKDNKQELILVLENYSGNQSELEENLSLKIPNYMIPGRIVSVKHFPYNTNGKIDRTRIKQMVTSD